MMQIAAAPAAAVAASAAARVACDTAATICISDAPCGRDAWDCRSGSTMLGKKRHMARQMAGKCTAMHMMICSELSKTCNPASLQLHMQNNACITFNSFAKIFASSRSVVSTSSLCSNALFLACCIAIVTEFNCKTKQRLHVAGQVCLQAYSMI